MDYLHCAVYERVISCIYLAWDWFGISAFKTPQALSSHITYTHRRVKTLEGAATPTPPEILTDPEILELRKKLEKRRLEKALEDIEETPKIIDLAERVIRLEETMKDVEKLKTYEQTQDKTLRSLTDWIDYLKKDNERHKIIISNFLLAYALAEGTEELFKTYVEWIEREYGLVLTKDLKLRRIN